MKLNFTEDREVKAEIDRREAEIRAARPTGGSILTMLKIDKEEFNRSVYYDKNVDYLY